jgi:hypothetical protein
VYERQNLIDKIGPEINLQYSGLVDERLAVEIGNIAGVNYMLIGAVSPIDNENVDRWELESTEKDSKGRKRRVIHRKVTEKHSVSVTISARVVEVGTSRVVWSGAETSDNSVKGKYISKTVDARNYRYGSLENEVAALMADLADEAAYFLASRLKREFVGEYIHVVEQSGGDFIIDAGYAQGLNPGMVFLICAEEKTVRGMDGRVLGSSPVIVAALKTKIVNDLFSVCSVAPPSVGKAIRRGDIALPIRFKNSSKLKYPKERPAGLPGDRKTEYGDDGVSVRGTAAPADYTPAPVFNETPPSPPSSPSAEPPVRGGYAWKDAPGVNRDTETGYRLIDVYPLDSGTRNTISVIQRGAYDLYTKKNYKDAFEKFSKLASDYECNYLSAYWAGMSAIKIGDAKKGDAKKQSYKEALRWFDRALAVNPHYKPALDASDIYREYVK